MEHEFYENKSGRGKAGSETTVVIQVQNECVSVCVYWWRAEIGALPSGEIDNWTAFLSEVSGT